MAVHTRHPVGPMPTPPVRQSTRLLLVRAYASFVLFTALAATFWYNLIGFTGFAILFGAGVLVSAGIWITLRPPFQWRRLPWFPLAFLAWAALSIIWSQWPSATLLTWSVLAGTTMQGLFLAAVLTWRELVRAVSAALKWVLGLSLVFELWVSLVIRHPVAPNFLEHEGEFVKEYYWSRDNLFDWGERIQGIVGNAHLLGIAALLGLIVFAVRFAAGVLRGWNAFWIVVSVFLLWRANSGTVWIAFVAVLVVLGTVLLMRTTSRPGERTKYYVLYGATGLALIAFATFGRDLVFGALGKSSDLTERTRIWDAVGERIAEHPVIGWGYSTPWVPWDSAFDGWIVVNGHTTFQAHSVWVDTLFQLGWIGVVVLALTYLALAWRSWFFAIDRPRWDLVDNRPYQVLTVLPTLLTTVILVQGLVESRPLMEWGWLFLVMLGAKIKQSPLVGEGAAETRLAIERGDLLQERS